MYLPIRLQGPQIDSKGNAMVGCRLPLMVTLVASGEKCVRLVESGLFFCGSRGSIIRQPVSSDRRLDCC